MLPLIGMSRFIAAGVGLALFAAATAPVLAQQIPGTVEPGRREIPEAPLPKEPVQLDWTVVLPGGADVPPHLVDEIINFVDLVIEGATVYTRDELLDIFAERRGEEITFGELYGFAKALQTRYQSDGYLLSFAYVPPQRVNDGIYRIVAVEGFVDRILVEDVEGRLKRTLERRLAPITEARPLRVAVLERYMLLANDLPGITASGVLQPSSDQPGASDLVIKTTHMPVSASAVVDNRGSRFEGPWHAGGDASLNSILGLGEQFAAVVSSTPLQPEEMKSINLSYLQPLGDQGMQVSANGGYTRSRPGFTLEDFDILTTGLSFGLDVSYPVIRSRRLNLTLSSGVSYRNTEVELLDSPFTRDRIRSTQAAISMSENGFLGGATGLHLQLTQGLPVLNATDPEKTATSRNDANPAFTKVDFSIARAQPLYDAFSLTVTASGQYSFSHLPASEEYAVGGPRFGRAYDAAAITGENGIAGSLQLNYGIYPETSWIERIIPYLFYDIGKAWDDETSSSVGLNESLASAGLGLQVILAEGINFKVEYAKPLTEVPVGDDKKNGTVFITLNAGF